MFFKTLPFLGPSFNPVIAYLKKSNQNQFDRDIALLDVARSQFQESFSLVVEKEDETKKLADILSGASLGNALVIIVPDFSHLGFWLNHWESAMGDLFCLMNSGVRLISVRDGFDSKNDSARDAIDIICEKMKNQKAA